VATDLDAPQAPKVGGGGRRWSRGGGPFVLKNDSSRAPKRRRAAIAGTKDSPRVQDAASGRG
jgi:hypothetical protein